MEWFIPILIIVLGMWGGQNTKETRRIGVPLLATAFVYLQEKKKKDKLKGLFLLLLYPLLSMGYGQNSRLSKFFKHDWLVRIVYGLLVSIPFVILGLWYSPIFLSIAYSIRDKWLPFPGFKIYKDYDFLWEDFIRFSTIGIMVLVVIKGG